MKYLKNRTKDATATLEAHMGSIHIGASRYIPILVLNRLIKDDKKSLHPCGGPLRHSCRGWAAQPNKNGIILEIAAVLVVCRFARARHPRRSFAFNVARPKIPSDLLPHFLAFCGGAWRHAARQPSDLPLYPFGRSSRNPRGVPPLQSTTATHQTAWAGMVL